MLSSPWRQLPISVPDNARVMFNYMLTDVWIQIEKVAQMEAELPVRAKLYRGML